MSAAGEVGLNRRSESSECVVYGNALRTALVNAATGLLVPRGAADALAAKSPGKARSWACRVATRR